MVNILRIRGIFEDAISGPLSAATKKIRGLEDAVKSKDLKPILTGVGLAAGAKAFDILGGAIAGAGDVIRDSIDAASDLNETLSKSRVVFGSSARTVEEWGRTMAEAGGLSTQAAVEAAATFGNFLTSLVGSRQKAAEMSMQLVQLASDLASFNNLDPTEVLDKLRSGLSGEAEPMRRLGVFLSEAKVKAKAMEMGLADAHGELSEGAKVLARYQIILDETKTAQGDFARTADGLANSQRRLAAELKNTQAELGEKLLPVQLEVTKAQIHALDGANDLISAWNALTGQSKDQTQALRDQATAAAVVQAVFGAIPGVVDATNEVIRHNLAEVQQLTDAQRQSEQATQAWSDRLSGLARAYGQTGQNAQDAATGVEAATKAVKRSIPTAEDARRSWEDLASALGEAIFGPAELRGREAGLQIRLRDLKDEMRKERDPLRLKEIEGDIASANQELLETRMKLALLGDQTEKDRLQPYFVSLADKIRGASDEAKTLYSRILAL